MLRRIAVHMRPLVQSSQLNTCTVSVTRYRCTGRPTWQTLHIKCGPTIASVCRFFQAPDGGERLSDPPLQLLPAARTPHGRNEAVALPLQRDPVKHFIDPHAIGLGAVRAGRSGTDGLRRRGSCTDQRRLIPSPLCFRSSVLQVVKPL